MAERSAVDDLNYCRKVMGHSTDIAVYWIEKAERYKAYLDRTGGLLKEEKERAQAAEKALAEERDIRLDYERQLSRLDDILSGLEITPETELEKLTTHVIGRLANLGAEYERLKFEEGGRKEAEACRALYDRILTICSYDPKGGHPGVIEAVKALLEEKQKWAAIAGQQQNLIRTLQSEVAKKQVEKKQAIKMLEGCEQVSQQAPKTEFLNRVRAHLEKYWAALERAEDLELAEKAAVSPTNWCDVGIWQGETNNFGRVPSAATLIAFFREERSRYRSLWEAQVNNVHALEMENRYLREETKKGKVECPP